VAKPTRRSPTLLDPLGVNDVAIVTSAHGEELGEHGGYGHGRTLYEEVVHVPLLVARAEWRLAALRHRLAPRRLRRRSGRFAGVAAKPSRGQPLLHARRTAARRLRMGRRGDLVRIVVPGREWISRNGKSVRFDLRADPKELHPIATTDGAERRARIVQALGVTDDARFAAP
jgi:hypothetical protein